MSIDGHKLPCCFADGFCKPTTKTPFTLVWFSDDLCFFNTLQELIGRMTETEDRFWIETDSFVTHTQQNLIQLLIIKEHHSLMYMLHTHKIDIILNFHAFKYFQMLKHFVVNPNLYIEHNTLIFS